MVFLPGVLCRRHYNGGRAAGQQRFSRGDSAMATGLATYSLP
jgi:hypothetical protein